MEAFAQRDAEVRARPEGGEFELLVRFCTEFYSAAQVFLVGVRPWAATDRRALSRELVGSH